MFATTTNLPVRGVQIPSIQRLRHHYATTIYSSYNENISKISSNPSSRRTVKPSGTQNSIAERPGTEDTARVTNQNGTAQKAITKTTVKSTARYKAVTQVQQASKTVRIDACVSAIGHGVAMHHAPSPWTMHAHCMNVSLSYQIAHHASHSMYEAISHPWILLLSC